MPVSNTFKAIFVHIPKNAGESIEKSLRMYGGDPNETLWGDLSDRIVLQHYTASAIRHFLSNDAIWNSYVKFAVVRNPWSKAVSEYNWYLRFGPKCSFREWVFSLEHRIKINEYIHRREIAHNIPQFKFVTDPAGKLLVNRILRFENLNEDFREFAAEQNWAVELGHVESTKSSDSRDFREYYDKNSIDEIERVYRKDLDAFGYSKSDTF